MKKLHVKKNDVVKVISGNYKNEKGKVLKVLVKDNKAIVEKINMVSKHIKNNKENPKGGIIKKEAPIHISNLMLIDTNGNATRIKRSKNEKGNSIRISVKNKEEIK